MPRHHSLRLHDDQGLAPSRPYSPEHNPEQPVETMQSGPGLLPLENSELLAESDGFQGEFVPRQEESPNVRDHRESESNHQPDHS